MIFLSVRGGTADCEAPANGLPEGDFGWKNCLFRVRRLFRYRPCGTWVNDVPRPYINIYIWLYVMLPKRVRCLP